MSTISVIIPTWNRASLLGKAIRSALSQTIPPMEVLVCDDGSTDNTRQVMDAIGDARVRLLTGARGGRPAIPRNRGIREAKGEWLAFLDDDDEWVPEKLERQLDHARKLDCRAACSDAVRLLTGHGTDGSYLSLAMDRLNFSALLHVNQVICSSAMIHRSLIPLVEGFPEDEALKALEDYSLWLRVATQTDFAYVAEPLVMYRDQLEDSIRTHGQGEWEQRRRVLANLLRWLAGKGLPGVSFKTRLHYYRAVLNTLTRGC
ncbi:MAG: glycosyltransferase family 2 protein [Geobacter sp.]|nr:glycosyltransferase family 2 protein [Geobacter sp.]